MTDLHDRQSFTSTRNPSSLGERPTTVAERCRTAAVGESRRSVAHVLRERRKWNAVSYANDRGIRPTHGDPSEMPVREAMPVHFLACTAGKLVGRRRGEPFRPRVNSLRSDSDSDASTARMRRTGQPAPEHVGGSESNQSRIALNSRRNCY